MLVYPCVYPHELQVYLLAVRQGPPVGGPATTTKSILAQLQAADAKVDDIDRLAKMFLAYIGRLEVDSGKARPGLIKSFRSVYKHHVTTCPDSRAGTAALALVWRLERLASEDIGSGGLDIRAKYRPALIHSDDGFSGSLSYYSILNGSGVPIADTVKNPEWTPLVHASRMLLEKGANPNEDLGAKTLWEEYLQPLLTAKSFEPDSFQGDVEPQFNDARLQIIRALILHGAARSGRNPRATS